MVSARSPHRPAIGKGLRWIGRWHLCSNRGIYVTPSDENSPLPLHEALDLDTSVTLYTSSNTLPQARLALGDEAFADGDAAYFGEYNTGMTLSNTGPAILTFAYKSLSQFSINGTFLSSPPEAGSRWIPTMAWVNDSPSFRSNAGWLDSLKVWKQSSGPYSELQASEDVGVQFRTASDKPWEWTQYEQGDERMHVLLPEESWMEATVSGPGVFQFTWRTDDAAISLLVNGIPYLRDQWHHHEDEIAIELPPGNHVLRWEYEQTDHSWLRNFSFAPNSSISQLENLAEHMTTPLIRGDVVSNPDSDTGGVTLGPRDTTLASTVSGPGILEIDYRFTPTRRELNTARVIISGPTQPEETYWLSASEDTQTIQTVLDSAPHHVRIELDTDHSEAAAESVLHIDRLHLAPLDAGTEDHFAFPLTERQGSWLALPTTNTNTPGGLITQGFANATTWLETTFTGPGLIQFEWTATHAEASCLYNGQSMAELNRTGSAQRDSLTIPAGDATVRWLAGDGGRLIVRPLSFQTLETPLLAAAAGTSSLPWYAPDSVPMELKVAESPLRLILAERRRVATAIDTTSFGFASMALENRAFVFLDGVNFPDSLLGNFGLLLTEGPHELQWRSKSSSESTLSKFSYVASNPVELATALDNTQEWRTSESEPWIGLTGGILPDQEDVAISGQPPAGESSWIETTITGPAHVQFRSFSQYHKEQVGFLLNGTLQFPPSHSIFANNPTYSLGWSQGRYDLPPGEHSLRWTYSREAGVTQERPHAIGYLDSVTTHPSEEGFAHALDLNESRLIQATGINPPSILQDERARKGDTLVHLPVDSILSIPIEGPAYLSYYLYSNTETEQAIHPNSDSSLNPRLPQGWSRHGLTVDQGIHSLLWKVERSVQDTEILLDDFSIQPPIALEAALDNSLSFSASSQWQASDHEGAPTGVHLSAISESSGPLEARSATIETTVTGPGILRFWWKGTSRPTDLLVNGETLASSGLTWQEEVLSLDEGDWEVQWQVDGAATAYLDRVSFLPTYSFDQWLTDQGLTARSPENLLRFASIEQGPEALITHTAGEDYLTLQYAQRKDSPLAYHPRFGSNLTEWSEECAVVSITSIDEMWDRVTVRDTEPFGQLDSRFGAVRVELK